MRNETPDPIYAKDPQTGESFPFPMLITNEEHGFENAHVEWGVLAQASTASGGYDPARPVGLHSCRMFDDRRWFDQCVYRWYTPIRAAMAVLEKEWNHAAE
jgi:hypothetical protein